MSEQAAKRSGPGWIATIAGAGLLIVLGFGVGLVAGAAYEEPALVADHLAGNTTDVPLPPAAEPRVREQTTDATDAEPETRAPAQARPGAATPAGGYAVQVGAFATGAAADGLAAELRALGHAAYVADEGGNGARYKVRVGPIASRAEADALADQLKREQRLPTWVLAREAR
ncbi:MAG TPA: SPOR domain-containing protein [Myxococcota bacterium]|nr:SPOR domain-containing protein [Myxococcota bacterium]